MNPILLDFPDHFETERLLIRSPRPGDGKLVYDAVIESLDSLKPWMDWAHQELSPEIQETVVRRMHVHFIEREDLPLLLLCKETGGFLGGSGLHRFDLTVPRFEIGYWMRSSQQGKGYVTEAVAGITHFAFEQLRAERVEIRMDDLNERSWRVPERLQFKLEGTLRRDARNVYGGLRDTRIYSMIRDEWVERNNFKLARSV